MAEPIGPGDLVECVEPEPYGVLKVGSVYTCEEIGESPPVTIRRWIMKWLLRLKTCDCDSPWIELCGVEHPRSRYGITWCACGFRPISRRSDFEAILTQLKQPRDDVRAPEPETV